MAGLAQCEDVMMFQRALKQLRAIDDKIIYALNVSNPTASMQARGADPKQRCPELRAELDSNYKERGERINHCVSVLEGRQGGPGGQEARMDRIKLRTFKSELDVEEIVKHRTEEIFKTKCAEHL